MTAFNIRPATPDIVRKFIGHGLTMPVPSKSTVEQIASRIRHREHYARNKKRIRLKSKREVCKVCDGQGWYATGAVDNPVQLQCSFCHGTGYEEKKL